MTTPTPTDHRRLRLVGNGQLAVSSDPAETLITDALGNCLAVTAYDRMARVGALVCAQLPLPPGYSGEPRRYPGRFVETGVLQMLAELEARGASRPRIDIHAAGAARRASSSSDDYFEIGRRSVVAFKKVLWQAGLLIRACEVGGMVSRTLSLRIEDGLVVVTTPTTTRALGGEEPWL